MLIGNKILFWPLSKSSNYFNVFSKKDIVKSKGYFRR